MQPPYSSDSRPILSEVADTRAIARVRTLAALPEECLQGEGGAAAEVAAPVRQSGLEVLPFGSGDGRVMSEPVPGVVVGEPVHQRPIPFGQGPGTR